MIVCTPKILTGEQAELAVRRSIEVNPVNASAMRQIERTAPGRRGGPRRLALLVGNRWPASGVRLSVQFLDNPSRALRKRILEHMNAWDRHANVAFVETQGVGEVRIARLDDPPDMAGYWSYVGTQVLAIPENEPTLNLQGFTMRTSESEFRRVVRHEAGHTLGFEHEHMRKNLIKKIDRQKAIAYYDLHHDWSRQETINQVLTPLSERSLMGTEESDPLSIMCYEIPGEITKDGEPIVGGLDINPKDHVFAGKVYPKPSNALKDRVDDPPVADGKPVGVAPMTSTNDDEFHIIVMDAIDPQSGEGPAESPKYARVFASYGGARVTSLMRLNSSKGEPRTNFGKIIATHKKIKNYTNAYKGSLPSDQDLVTFGGHLFDTLFQGDVKRLYDVATGRKNNGKLSLVFTSMISWIAEKPWEFAYDTVRKSFLATEEIHLLRNVLTSVPADVTPPTTGPIRILVVVAQPVSYGRLSAEQEIQVIRRGFAPLIDAGLVTIQVLPRATPSRVHELLTAGSFDVVHFIGHGTFDEEAEAGALVFEDENGGEILLNDRSAREIFCQRGIKLVFLNACQTGSGGRSDFNKGIAQSLVAHGLPALVANQYSVLDVSATNYAKWFYWCLAHGLSVSKAATEARIAVNHSVEGESIDWAVPVTYARNPDMTLCRLSGDVTTMGSSDIQASLRSEAVPTLAGMRSTVDTPHDKRIAVWDVDNSFPSLESTLQAMSDAQSVFGFELVSLSAPFDAWYTDEPNPEGGRYLWAEKLAKRLERSAVELGVDLLICVTRHWMCDTETLNIYAWWSEQQSIPVSIFSYAGFNQELAVANQETDRAIANTLVSVLTGHFANADTHLSGSRSCPLYYNQERDLASITKPGRFDKSCRDKLKRSVPELLPAFESLLSTFG